MSEDMSQSTSKAFHWHGFLGLTIMLAAEVLLLRGNAFVATWLTPIMWTGYILLVDAIIYRLQGRSWLTTRRREFPLLVLLSVGVWLIFEVYNFHLHNWFYTGLPDSDLLRNIGYFWSFATIMPGVFETAELIEVLISRKSPPPQERGVKMFDRRHDLKWSLVGLIFVTLPLLLPSTIAKYLFALVWLGFIFLLEPVNRRLGADSLFQQLRKGETSKMVTLLAAGLVCGFIWEAWNFQAFNAQGAYWVYTIPQPLRIFGWHYGMMPVLGLLGFPPFAWELHAFYHLLRRILGGDRVFGAESSQPRGEMRRGIADG
jgi:hypothetical protein